MELYANSLRNWFVKLLPFVGCYDIFGCFMKSFMIYEVSNYEKLFCLSVLSLRAVIWFLQIETYN